MFNRRAPKSSVAILRDFLWPRNGWRRAGEYLWHRLHRLPGSPHSIAAGLASGSALSVTPIIGIHFFMAALLAWLLRANVVAAAFGTVIGNPWTFPIIWMTTYHLGRFMMGYGFSFGEEMDFTTMFMGMVQSMIEADGAMFAEQVLPIWLPMLVGSIPSAIFTWVVVYFTCFRLTATYQHRRRVRRRMAKTTTTPVTTEKQDMAV